MSATESGTGISEDEIEQFHERGYAFLPGFFDTDRVERLQDEANRILELLINSSIANNRRSRRLEVNQHEDGSQSIRVVQPFIDLSREYKRIAVEDLLALLGPLMNDTPVSLDRTSQLNYKQPLPDKISELGGVPFSGNYPVHADWPYFEGKAPKPTDFIITSVFVDACTENNGPLEIWPGTHKEPYEHNTTELGAYQVPSDRINYDEGEKLCGPAGSVVIFDAKLIHSSEPNSTGRPRRLAIYRHAPETNVETQIQGGSALPGNYGFPQEIVESTYENEYRRLKRNDEYQDQFVAPEF